MTRLYCDTYQDLGYEWDLETSKKYLQHYFCPEFAKYCLAAVDDSGNCLGAIFCNTDFYETGKSLYVGQVQVKPEFRKLGIAKALITKVLELAKENGCVGTHLLADSTKFTPDFYKSLGYESTGWIEMEKHF